MLACQAAALLWTVVTASLQVLLNLPYALLRCCAAAVSKAPRNGGSAGQCIFYEGTVEHVRKRPVHHAFK